MYRPGMTSERTVLDGVAVAVSSYSRAVAASLSCLGVREMASSVSDEPAAGGPFSWRSSSCNRSICACVGLRMSAETDKQAVRRRKSDLCRLASS